MGFVVFLALVLWGVGVLMKAPYVARFSMLGMLYLAVLLALAVLPEAHALRRALDMSLAGWLTLGGVLVLIAGYRALLMRLRRRANPKEPEISDQVPGSFSGTELERYARHIMLREIGGPGQQKLKAARVLVIGAGGLGSPVLMYLAAAGVGTIGIVDDDRVDLSNLQRQIVHADARLGMPKVFSAQQAMAAINPHVEIRPYHCRLDAEEAAALFAEYDLIVDGCDNFDTRYLVNAAAVAAGKPLISGAITQWEGQVSLYEPARGGPCYACVFPRAPDAGLAPSCVEAGVIGALPGVVGAMMALEAIKRLTGAGQDLLGRMIIYDALYAENRVMAVAPRSGCPTCAAHQA